MVLGGRSWVLHCLGISWTISLLPSTPAHPQWHSSQVHGGFWCWGGHCCPTQAFFCGEMGSAGHWDSCEKLSGWESSALGNECCKERLLQPISPCWRLPEPISPATSAATQESGIGQTENIIQSHPQPLLSLCNAASSHPISVGTFIESTAIPFSFASFSLPKTMTSTRKYSQDSLQNTGAKKISKIKCRC